MIIINNNDSFVNSWFETWYNYIRFYKNYDDDAGAINIEFLQDIPYLTSMDFSFNQQEYSDNNKFINDIKEYYNKETVNINNSNNHNKSMLKYISHVLNLSITNPYSIFRQFDENDEFYFEKTNNNKSLRQTIIEDIVCKFDTDEYNENFAKTKTFTMVSTFPEENIFTDISLLLQLNIEKNIETIEYIIFNPESDRYSIFNEFIDRLKYIHDNHKLLSSSAIDNSKSLLELYPLANINFTNEITKKDSNLFLQLYQFAYMKKLLMYKKGIDLKIKIYNNLPNCNVNIDCDLIFCIDYISDFHPYPWQIPAFFNYFARKNTIILNMYKHVFEDKNLSNCWSTIVTKNKLCGDSEDQKTVLENNAALLKKDFFQNDEENRKKQYTLSKQFWKNQWTKFYIYSDFDENTLAECVDFNNNNNQQHNNTLYYYLNPYNIIEKSLLYTNKLLYYFINLIRPNENVNLVNSQIYSSSYSNIKNIKI